jgi:hypothetical protein
MNAKNGAFRQNGITQVIISKFLRLSAESLKMVVFGAGE